MDGTGVKRQGGLKLGTEKSTGESLGGNAVTILPGGVDRGLDEHALTIIKEL